jgi:hypothetical protein
MEPGSGTRTNMHLTLYLPHHTNTAIPVGANEVSAQCMKMMGKWNCRKRKGYGRNFSIFMKIKIAIKTMKGDMISSYPGRYAPSYTKTGCEPCLCKDCRITGLKNTLRSLHVAAHQMGALRLYFRRIGELLLLCSLLASWTHTATLLTPARLTTLFIEVRWCARTNHFTLCVIDFSMFLPSFSEKHWNFFGVSDFQLNAWICGWWMLALITRESKLAAADTNPWVPFLGFSWP